MVASAWDAGLDGQKIPDMTPAQVRGMFQVAQYKRRAQAANMDRGAWLSGNYAAMAFHSPKRYPNKPWNADKIMGDYGVPQEMTEDQMKDALVGIAKRWNNARKS